MIKTCKYCGKPFSSNLNQRIYCSDECFKKYRKKYKQEWYQRNKKRLDEKRRKKEQPNKELRELKRQQRQLERQIEKQKVHDERVQKIKELGLSKQQLDEREYQILNGIDPNKINDSMFVDIDALNELNRSMDAYLEKELLDSVVSPVSLFNDEEE